MNKKIIEKVKKLLSLAESSNENEAKLATIKANELIISHNLTMQEINDNIDYIENIHEDFSRASLETKFIHQIINNHFFVEVIYFKSYNLVNGKYKSNTKVLFVGESSNVQIASYVADFLKIKFKELWNKNKKEFSWDVSCKQSYYAGLCYGLCDQLNKVKMKVENERGLVVVNDIKIKEFLSKKHGKLGQRGTDFSVRNTIVYSNGIDHGKEIKISRGINDKSGFSGYIGKDL